MHTIYFNKTGKNNEQLIDSRRVRELNDVPPFLSDLHTTTFYELFVFNQVEGSLMVEGKTHLLSGPTVVLFPPLTTRQWDIQFDEQSYLVYFEAEFIESFLKDSAFLHRLHFFSCHLRVPVLPLTNEQHAQILPLVELLRTELGQLKTDSTYILRSYLYQLLVNFNRFYNNFHQLDSNLFQNSEIVQLKNLLRQHIQDKQTVQAYAEMLNMSRNKMNELSVKVFGKQAHQMIREELLQACKTELISSPLTISEISYKYNFSAPSNFTRFFRTHTGLSPASYREQFA